MSRWRPVPPSSIHIAGRGASPWLMAHSTRRSRAPARAAALRRKRSGGVGLIRVLHHLFITTAHRQLLTLHGAYNFSLRSKPEIRQEFPSSKNKAIVEAVRLSLPEPIQLPQFGSTQNADMECSSAEARLEAHELCLEKLPARHFITLRRPHALSRLSRGRR